MFRKIGDSLRGFMMGRNGMDALSWALWILALVMELLSSILGIEALSMLSGIPLILALFRMLSRNLEKRQAENQVLTQFLARIKGRKTHCYFRCPECKTRVRVPRGKGKIKITCPACRNAFVKKT